MVTEPMVRTDIIGLLELDATIDQDGIASRVRRVNYQPMKKEKTIFSRIRHYLLYYRVNIEKLEILTIQVIAVVKGYCVE